MANEIEPAAVKQWFREGYVQNEVGLGNYFSRITAGRLATVSDYSVTAEDRVRAAIIERLMCDL